MMRPQHAFRSKRGQIMLMDALVFFLILSVAAALPLLFAPNASTSMDASAFSHLQETSDAALLVILQSTIPVVEFPSEDGKAVVSNLRVDDGLRYRMMLMAAGEPTKSFRSFQENVSVIVSGAMPLGIQGCLYVEFGSESAVIGSAVTRNTPVASAEQHYPAEDMMVRLLVWRV